MALYTGMAGSPITYLTEAMTAEQTTATVSDGTALPEAPNLCTIGFGGEMETIRYGAKVGNSLSDITRGIEGVPRAWDVGTEVARFFTAYDHNAIINTLVSHLAESVTDDVHGLTEKTIENSGSNFIKFGNGVMVCWDRVEHTNVDVNTSNGSLFKSDPVEWIFPEPFISVPQIFFSTQASTRAYFIMKRNIFTDRVNYFFVGSESATYGTAEVDVFAIGKWK